MENAAQALVMAGQLLIFMVALTISISSFTELRASVTEMIGQTETIEMAQDSNGYINYIEAKDNDAIRVVGAETVVSSMYRALKENFVVYIKLNNLKNDLEMKNKVTDTGAVLIEYDPGNEKIDLSSLGIEDDDYLIKVTIGSDQNGINQRINSILRGTDNGEGGLYYIIKNKTFNEYLGEYQNKSAEGVPSANKLTKRIITYVEK